MAKRKVQKKEVNMTDLEKNVHIEGAGTIVEETVTDTLKNNYMPYAMSVILSRALPEIDGFKPSHRKLLYTMYLMNLISGARVKSANIVGRTMQLNPHNSLLSALGVYGSKGCCCRKKRVWVDQADN